MDSAGVGTLGMDGGEGGLLECCPFYYKYYCWVGEVGWTTLARDNRSCPQTSAASLHCFMAPNGAGGGGISRTGLWARAAFGEAATGWQLVVSTGRLLRMILFFMSCQVFWTSRSLHCPCMLCASDALLPRPRHVHAFAAGARAPVKKRDFHVLSS